MDRLRQYESPTSVLSLVPVVSMLVFHALEGALKDRRSRSVLRYAAGCLRQQEG